MARIKKSLPLDEQLKMVISEIESTEETLKNLKTTKKDLEEQIQKQELVELDKIIKASGKSLEDIKAMLIN